MRQFREECTRLPIEPCDHVWEFVDESFDHEYGTERVMFWRCLECDLIKEVETPDFDDSEQ